MPLRPTRARVVSHQCLVSRREGFPPPARRERRAYPPGSLRACPKTPWGPAARDFGDGQDGEVGASPPWAVTTEPTPAIGKRPAARRVFAPSAAGLCCSFSRRPMKGILLRRASPGSPSRENRAPRSFRTGSKERATLREVKRTAARRVAPNLSSAGPARATKLAAARERWRWPSAPDPPRFARSPATPGSRSGQPIAGRTRWPGPDSAPSTGIE